jgi:hypothetical protein
VNNKTPTRRTKGKKMLTSNNNSKTNSTWELTRASVAGLAHAIEAGNAQALSSYLGVMARFHTYSARNALLIAAQRPTASWLEGVRSWNELGRFVRPGEKGIFILAPTLGTQPGTPVKTGGKPKTSRKQNKPQAEPQLLGFRGVYVFDREQTGGEPLPESAKPVGLSDALEELTALAQLRGMTIEYSQAIGPKKGTSYRGRISLLADMEPAEEFPVLLQEVVSQILYSTPRPTFVTRAIHQQETQAAAFVVCEALALECKTEFSGCQLYYGDSRLLAESLQLVHRTAALILRAILTENAMPSKSAQEVQ